MPPLNPELTYLANVASRSLRINCFCLPCAEQGGACANLPSLYTGARDLNSRPFTYKSQTFTY